MTTYLIIITTALVLTQIIRLVQNVISLKRNDKTIHDNNYIISVFTKLEALIDKLDERCKNENQSNNS